jgi:hypothetical protein
MKGFLSDGLIATLVALQPQVGEVEKDYKAVVPLGWQCNCNSDNPCANGCRNSCSGRMH